MKRGQILLTAQNALVREGLKHLLATETLSIIREESTLQNALSFLRSRAAPIDLIVYDQNENRDEDIGYFTAIGDEFPQVGIAVLAAGKTHGFETAINGGPRAFLPNTISPSALSLVLQLLLVGEILVATPSSLSGILTSVPNAVPRNASEPRVPLSPREVEIL